MIGKKPPGNLPDSKFSVGFFCFLSLSILISWNIFFKAGTLRAEEQVILDVVINGHKIGQEFLWLTEDDDILVHPDFFSGLRLKKELFSSAEGDRISLKSLSEALKFKVDHNNAALVIAVAPQWFESRIIQPPPPPPPPKTEKIVKQPLFSGFINYQLEAEYYEKEGFSTYNLPWEIGLHWGDWFAFSNFTSRYSDSKGQTSRLMTNMTFDNPERLNRLIIGDFTAPSTAFLGGSVMGGVSWGTRFSLNNKFKPYPGLNTMVVLESPAKAELYSNGHLIREWELLPGPVRFEELNAYTGGNSELVLTDSFGRERRIELPQLFGGLSLLRKGVQEYSYNLGFLRQNFGTENFDYKYLSGMAFHRYGFTDWLTAGLGGAFQKDLAHISPLLSLQLGSDLLIDNEAIFSSGNGKNGYAFSSRSSYRKKDFSAALSLLYYSTDYLLPLSSGEFEENDLYPLRFQWDLTLSYTSPKWGGFNLAYVDIDFRDGPEDRSSYVSLNYSKNIFKMFNLVLSVRRTLEGAGGSDFFISLQYTPKDKNSKRFFDSTTYRFQDKEAEESLHELSIQKFPGLGKGIGYTLNAIRSGRETGGSGTLEYRHESGIAKASLLMPPGDDLSGRISWAGGIGFRDSCIYFFRPISDSFVVVEVEGLDDVPVYSGSSLAGRTGRRDTLMLPELSSYTTNHISIRPKDLPLDYEMKEKKLELKIDQRGGSYAKFKAFRFSAVEGNLYTLLPDGSREYLSTLPLDYMEEGEEISGFTGQKGYFYLENLTPGEYGLRIYRNEDIFHAVVTVPGDGPIVVNVGDVVCIPAE